MHLKNLLAVIFIFCSVALTAQDFYIGIRAGLNYSKMLGTQEEDESQGLNNGFHFGMHYGHQFSDVFTLRGEVVYTQKGSKQKFDGEGYHLFNLPQANRFVVYDSLQLDLDVSNAYISLPVTAHIRTLERWEFYAGGYVSFLVSPIAQGLSIFGTNDPRDSVRLEYSFEQAQNHSYFGDEAGQAVIGSTNIVTRVNGELANVSSLVGAYDLYQLKNKSKYKSVDYGLIVGAQYFLNPGLYFDLRFEYGLRDVTNGESDRSLREVNPDGTLIFRDDSDRNFGLEFGVGFRF